MTEKKYLGKIVLKNLELLNKIPHYCQCGCRQKIIIKKHHLYNGIPKYINGHQNIGKNRVFSESHKNNIRKSRIGKIHTDKTKRKMSDNLKRKYSNGEFTGVLGLKFSEDTKLKMSKAHKGKKYKSMSKKGRENISKSLIGHIMSDCLKLKQSIAWSGKRNSNWKGGITKNSRYTNDPRVKKWREAVFQRDNYTCQECGANKCYIEGHHIKSWARYPKLRYIISNGLTLCKPCHKKTPNYGGKKQNDKKS